jgi:putative component of toxin-antitoxin plasmid stabilization module
MEVQPKEIRNYLRFDGIDIFSEWFDSLRDIGKTIGVETIRFG